MLHRWFEYRFELDEFIEKLVENGHYGDFVIKFENELWHIYW